jgi:hypothetical protein
MATEAPILARFIKRAKFVEIIIFKIFVLPKFCPLNFAKTQILQNESTGTKFVKTLIKMFL